jgi:hypothetical protein
MVVFPTPEPIPDIDVFIERVLADPRNRKIVQEAKDFGSLKEDSGWRKLRAKVTGQRDSFMESIARRLMGGEDVSQREIDFHRGFYYGVNYATGIPEVVEDNLTRTARIAYALALNEFEQESIVDSPYLIGE